MADSLGQHEELSPLQQEVLDEYDRLSGNMKKVSLLPPVQRDDASGQPSATFAAAARARRI